MLAAIMNDVWGQIPARVGLWPGSQMVASPSPTQKCLVFIHKMFRRGLPFELKKNISKKYLISIILYVFQKIKNMYFQSGFFGFQVSFIVEIVRNAFYNTFVNCF